MERVDFRNSDKVNVFVYKTDSVFNKKSAVKFLIELRNKKDVLVKHIDLENEFRADEKNKSTILSGNVLEAKFINDVVSKNVNQISFFASLSGKSFIVKINLETFEISVLLHVKSILTIGELEKVLFLKEI